MARQPAIKRTVVKGKPAPAVKVSAKASQPVSFVGTGTVKVPHVKIKKPLGTELKGMGEEYTWENISELTDDQYMKRTMQAVHWYDYFHTRKDLAEWFRMLFKALFPKRTDMLKALNAAPDHSISVLLGTMLPMVGKGWRPNYRMKRNFVKGVRYAVEKGQEALIEAKAAADAKAAKTAVKPLTIQDHIQQQAMDIIQPLEEAIDAFIRNPKTWTADVKAVNVLKAGGAKAAQARKIKDYYAGTVAEHQELLAKSVDPQLTEAYRHYSKTEIKKFTDWLVTIVTACDQIIGERQAVRKPRAKKAVPAEAMVKNVKFKVSDNDLGIASISPAQIVGANVLVTYHVRFRKLAVYHAANVDPTGQGRGGLSVKGTTIIGFDEKKSEQRTLRKPAEQLKKFKDCGTLKKLEAFLDKEVRTTSVGVTGRLNEDTLLLKVYK